MLVRQADREAVSLGGGLGEFAFEQVEKLNETIFDAAMASNGAEGFALLEASHHLAEEAFHQFGRLGDFAPGYTHEVSFGEGAGAVGPQDAERGAKGHQRGDESNDRFVTAGIERGELNDAAIDEPDVVVMKRNVLAFPEGLKSSSVIASFE